MVIGAAAMFGVALASGIKLSPDVDFYSLFSESNNSLLLKLGIGLNHLSIFTCSSIAFAYILMREKWKSYFHWNHLDDKMMIKFVLLLFVSMPIITATAMALQQLELPDWANQLDNESIEALSQLLEMDNILDLVINLTVIALLPALGEELLFRGIIQKELVKKLVNPHVAIFIASFVFSAIHFQVMGFLPKFFLGLIFGYAYYWTKSLWYPMMLHFINNGLQVVILYFGPDIDASQIETAQENLNPLPIMISVVISIGLCYLIIKSILDQLKQEQSIV